MDRIISLGSNIRDFVGDNNLYERYFKARLDEWAELCVAMDTLEDTGLALKHFENSGLGNELGEKHLRLYGTLQAIFLQQDSIRHLHNTFLADNLEFDDSSPWMEIRNLRNLTIGHPIKRIKKKENKILRCFIAQPTISNTGFMLVIWDKEEGDSTIKNIDFKSKYKSYKLEAVSLLKKIHEAQRNWDKKNEQD